MKVTHTHRGHCQLCARIQAIDPGTGRIAKHGYTVAEHGYFVGTCPGSDLPSLHVERKTADEYIARARRHHADGLALIERLRAGKTRPTQAWNGKYEMRPAPNRPGRTREVKVMIPFADASPQHQQEAIDDFIRATERDAEHQRKYADNLTRWADEITGKVDAYRVEDLEPKEWKVGDEVRIGGKSRDGFDAVIEAIEDRPYKTRGWRVGGGTVMAAHARLTRPARAEKRGKPDGFLYPEGRVITEGRPAKVIWEPLRNIKRPLPPLAERLKKEDVL